MLNKLCREFKNTPTLRNIHYYTDSLTLGYSLYGKISLLTRSLVRLSVLGKLPSAHEYNVSVSTHPKVKGKLYTMCVELLHRTRLSAPGNSAPSRALIKLQVRSFHCLILTNKSGL